MSLIALSLLLAACGEEEGTTWKFITEEVDGQVQYEYAEEFANRISDKTDGEVTVEPYEYGGLGSEVDQVQSLQDGAVELAVMSPGFTGNMVKEGQIFALHFLFPDSVETTQEILNTSEALNTDLRERYEEHDITPLSFWTEGAMQWTSNAGIQEPADFEGLKMRVQESPLMMASYEAYGAAPQALSWSELYTGLDRGTVEGQENPIFFIYDAAFHEVQDTMTISNHNNYVAMTTVNTEWYNDLSDEYKEIVDETVAEMQDWVFEEQNTQNEDFLTQMQEDTEHPTEIIELTEEQRAAFREAALPVRDFYVNEVSEVDGAIYNKLLEEIQAATE
ncbi:DctP family TRAP transporter solute-binding subunit [Aquibacillus koreensis]|uniref:DctP family TRAP transporter solute-binding subunit n=1 Tax=Aquibacillus koreensis TaxID=279446 RepID=A0A9X3WLB5_9BACI|nr:DctP family TRAP transporter solute-binding subunit [Aquibacillus koreensis]MCT2538246.1 DctP family TRAP transporter solute-binding subunit [Aquibacillus koreensis]MDC3420810.1 DctP family TRAP transporter solute-binding subunit [Aquibacillus koreensis]